MASLAEMRSSAFNCIINAQVASGEIPTYEIYPTLPDKVHLGWHITFPSPFVHSCVLYSLLKVDDDRVNPILENGKKFLLNTKDANDLWRFYVTDDVKNPVVFDADDTAMASYVLGKLGEKTNGRKIIAKNLNSNGLPYTWFWPRNWTFFHSPKLYFRLRNQAKTASEVLAAGLFHPDDVEPCVVANVLLSFPSGKTDDRQRIANWLVEAWKSETPIFQFYYKRIILAYHISRAYANGVTELGALKDEIVSFLNTESQCLEFAEQLVAGLTFKNFDCLKETKQMAELVLSTATEGGFQWEPYPYFTSKDRLYFAGSSALTAAWFLELVEGFNANADSQNILP